MGKVFLGKVVECGDRGSKESQLLEVEERCGRQGIVGHGGVWGNQEGADPGGKTP